ncbi:MAG: adenine phosphoribosyltransferase [Legionellales bacterium]|nr:adenine phosphoribosyltransferase [Legionellales bacterium]
MEIQAHIRQVKDFPKQGINFFDISTLMANPMAYRYAIDALAKQVASIRPDFILGIESRGFLVAPPLALSLDCGFGMIRKKGRLPGKTISHQYELEYGHDEIEIQLNVVPKNARVLVVDDLIATGGTLLASFALLEQIQANVVGAACLIELNDLGARERLKCPFFCLLSCPSQG